VPACTNCGAELPAGARFCPRCTAPVEPFETTAEEEDGARRDRSWRRRTEPIAFGALAILFAALVVLLVLVFGFGFLVEDSS
jgi:hypothetical protein